MCFTGSRAWKRPRQLVQLRVRGPARVSARPRSPEGGRTSDRGGGRRSPFRPTVGRGRGRLRPGCGRRPPTARTDRGHLRSQARFAATRDGPVKRAAAGSRWRPGRRSPAARSACPSSPERRSPATARARAADRCRRSACRRRRRGGPGGADAARGSGWFDVGSVTDVPQHRAEDDGEHHQPDGHAHEPPEDGRGEQQDDDDGGCHQVSLLLTHRYTHARAKPRCRCSAARRRARAITGYEAQSTAVLALPGQRSSPQDSLERRDVLAGPFRRPPAPRRGAPGTRALRVRGTARR